MVAARSATLTIETDQAEGVAATVTRIVPHGSGLEVELAVGSQMLIVREPVAPDASRAPGDNVTVTIPSTVRAVPA
jgi:hypothetical protein